MNKNDAFIQMYVAFMERWARQLFRRWMNYVCKCRSTRCLLTDAEPWEDDVHDVVSGGDAYDITKVLRDLAEVIS